MVNRHQVINNHHALLLDCCSNATFLWESYRWSAGRKHMSFSVNGSYSLHGDGTLCYIRNWIKHHWLFFLKDPWACSFDKSLKIPSPTQVIRTKMLIQKDNLPDSRSSWGQHGATPGARRPQMGPILAPWTLLSGISSGKPGNWNYFCLFIHSVLINYDIFVYGYLIISR